MTQQPYPPPGPPGPTPSSDGDPSRPTDRTDETGRRSFADTVRTVLGLTGTGRAGDRMPHSAASDPDKAFLFDLATGLLLAATCGLLDSQYGAQLLASFGLTLPWIVRRRWPALSLIVATLAAILELVVSDRPLFAIVAVPMLIYSYARWTNHRFARTGLAVGLVGAFLGPIRWALPNSVTAVGVFVVTGLACSGLVALAYVIGSRRRERAERVQQTMRAQLEQQRLMAAEREQRARVATINERNRIARELHDIVAHSLSVIVVQAEGGRALAAKKPEKAPEVLSTIADTSREALAEMRQMVGLLRSGGAPGDPAADGSPDGYLPTPGLDDLPDLISRTGDRVALTEYGARPTINQALGLAVYRVVQESLTNVLKHAGPSAHAGVSVTYAPEGIGIRVVDNGIGTEADGDGKGNGVRGMRERVILHGGTLSAQPRPGGGFEVLAWLPYPGRGPQQPRSTQQPPPTRQNPGPPGPGQPCSGSQPGDRARPPVSYRGGPYPDSNPYPDVEARP
jgi:signal transduction histidine kinase